MAKEYLRRGQAGTRNINRALSEATTLPACTVETAPAAEDNEGRLVYVTDGAEGDPCLAFSDGSDWLQIALGAAITDGE